MFHGRWPTATVAMTADVVHFDPAAAVDEGGRDVAAEKRGRPAAMIGLQQQIAVVGALG